MNKLKKRWNEWLKSLDKRTDAVLEDIKKLTLDEAIVRLDWHLRRLGHAERRAGKSESLAAAYLEQFDKLEHAYKVLVAAKQITK